MAAMSRYIPPDLISNILARLPVKDVLRCTAVCKSWYSIVTSSDFTLLHLKLSTPNQTPPLLTQYLLCHDYHKGCYSQCYSLLDQDQTVGEIPVPDPLMTDFCHLIGSSNGLCPFHMYRKDEVLLWNPSLRKLLILPKPRVSSEYDHTLGFGFLPETNNYKIVWLSYYLNRVEGQIYDLNAGSWRDIVKADDSIPFKADTLYTSYKTVMKDIIHWPAKSRGTLDIRPTIGTFNLKNEKFGTLAVPSLYVGSSFSLSTFQDSLCFSSTGYRGYSIWVMKEYGVTDSWTELYKLDAGFPVEKCVYFRENGEILLETRTNESIGNSLVLYDPVNNKVIKNIIPSVQDACLFITNCYIESLFLINGLPTAFLFSLN